MVLIYWGLWAFVLILLWGGLFTWIIAPLLGRLGLKLEHILLRNRGIHTKVPSVVSCLLIFVVIVVINIPILERIVNLAFWLAERS